MKDVPPVNAWPSARQKGKLSKMLELLERQKYFNNEGSETIKDNFVTLQSEVCGSSSNKWLIVRTVSFFNWLMLSYKSLNQSKKKLLMVH